MQPGWAVISVRGEGSGQPTPARELGSLGKLTLLPQSLQTPVSRPNDSITAFNTLPSPVKMKVEEIFKVSRAPKANNHFLSYFSEMEETPKPLLHLEI